MTIYVNSMTCKWHITYHHIVPVHVFAIASARPAQRKPILQRNVTRMTLWQHLLQCHCPLPQNVAVHLAHTSDILRYAKLSTMENASSWGSWSGLSKVLQTHKRQLDLVVHLVHVQYIFYICISGGATSCALRL